MFYLVLRSEVAAHLRRRRHHLIGRAAWLRVKDSMDEGKQQALRRATPLAPAFRASMAMLRCPVVLSDLPCRLVSSRLV